MSPRRQYAEVWRIPGGPDLLVWGLIGRLGIGMTPLALLLLIQHSQGRYTPAAVAAAAYAMAGAVASPVVSRLADRSGPARVLRVTAVAHTVVLAVLLPAVHAGLPLGIVWALAAVAGATYPPSSVALRGAWSALTGPDSARAQLRSTALAAETTTSELVYTVGPLLVAAFVAVGSATLALAASAVATLVGVTAIARSRAMRSWRPHPRHAHAKGLGPLTVKGFGPVLLCAFGLCISFGVVPVAIPGYATAHGGHDAGIWAGVLLGLWGVGSAAAGIWYGTRPHRAALHLQFAALLAFFVATLVVQALMPNLIAFAVAILIGGTAVAPALTVEYALVARIAPPAMVTEAYAWLMAVAVTANSAGTAVTGPILDHPGGVPWAFLLAAAGVGMAALLAAWPNGPLARGLAANAPAPAVPGTGKG